MKKEIIVDGKKIKVDENKLNKLIEESEKVWKPEDDAYYWFIGDTYSQVEKTYWDNEIIDNQRYSMGNCFKTEEEAEFAREKLKVIAELKRFALENNEEEIDWYDETQAKWFICYQYYDEFLTVSNDWSEQSNYIYFTSEKIAEDAIEAIGAKRLKKYYFGIKDDE